MRFASLRIPGAFRIEPERARDERGHFARTWCVREAEAAGLDLRLVQCSVSVNWRRGTLRGLHYQAPPHGESKLVRCSRGAMFDVLLDLRKDSPSYLEWDSLELSAENGLQVYIPEGVAHGFQTLEEDTEVVYQMSEFYHPDSARGVRWNDPAFGIKWPLATPILSERDASYPDFR